MRYNCAMKNNDKICILGATGFVGTELCAQLLARGYAITVLTRNPDNARHLRVLPSLSVQVVKDFSSDTISLHLKGCSVLINLIGILNERGHRGTGFHRAHVDITRASLQACENSGVNRYLQMSALNADPNGPSHYLRSKGKAEAYLNAFARDKVNITIFKPSVIFGADDSFLNRFAALLKFTPGVFPLACGHARFAPVYVGDVVASMVNSIENKSCYGQSYELCGPKEYTLKELVEYVAKLSGYNTKIISLPLLLSKMQAMALEFVPGKPFSLDNYNSLKVDSVCAQGCACETSLESIAPSYLGTH